MTYHTVCKDIWDIIVMGGTLDQSWSITFTVSLFPVKYSFWNITLPYRTENLILAKGGLINMDPSQQHKIHGAHITISKHAAFINI